MDGLNSRVESRQNKISELECRFIELIQWTEKKQTGTKAITKELAFVLAKDNKERKERMELKKYPINNG